MAGFVYARVSRTEQAVNGHSLPDQVRQGLAELDIRGIEPSPASNMDCPGAFVDPGVSAWKVKTTDRNGFSQMWAQAKSGDTIVIVSLDRMFRSVLDFAQMSKEFTERGLTLVSLRENLSMDTAAGRFMCHVAASFAQLKSDLISERRREAIAWMKRSQLDRVFIKKTKVKRYGATVEPQNQPLKVVETDELTKQLVMMRTGETIPQALTRIGNQNVMSTAPKPVVPGAKVWGYLRVSSLDQSNDSQRLPVARVMDRMVSETCIEQAEVVEDHGVSAYTKSFAKRDGGKKLMMLMKPGDHLVVSRIDRMFRSVRDMMLTIDVLTKKGITVHAADAGWRTDTADGRRFIDLMSMMAEWEAREIGWRTKMTHKYLAITSGDPIAKTWAPSRTRRWKFIYRDGQYSRVLNTKYCFKLVAIFELAKFIGPTAAVYLMECHEAISDCRLPLSPATAFVSLRKEEMREARARISNTCNRLRYSRRAKWLAIKAMKSVVSITTFNRNRDERFPDLVKRLDPDLCRDAAIEAERIFNAYIDTDTLTPIGLIHAVKRFFFECQTLNFEDPLVCVPSIDEIATRYNLFRRHQLTSQD